jgi:hypothetical protein
VYATSTTLETDLATSTAVEALITASPEGLIAHVAGSCDEGWRIIDVWESEAHCRRFQEEVLWPAVGQAVGNEPGRPLRVDTVHGELEQLGNAVRRQVAL